MATKILVYLQILKYPIDYFTKEWLGKTTPYLSYLDLSWIIRALAPDSYPVSFYVVVVLMVLYLAMILSLISPQSETASKVTGTIVKVMFMLLSSLGFMPFVGTILT